MSSVIQPTSIEGFREAIQAAAQQGTMLQLSGGRSKTQPDADVGVLSTVGYTGIVDHQASDFTITARAGTPIHEVRHALARAGQHLPFDPACVERGATVGGLVAAGLNGPCRLKHGGIRDFVIGCQFIDGNGTVIRAGGKVVKNAAGFDLPKFFVGSAGRFGLITEVTFKVFPQPELHRTFRFPASKIDLARSLMENLATLLDWTALEILTDGVVLARMASDTPAALDARAVQLREEVRRDQLVGDFDSTDEDDSLWSELANLGDVAQGQLLVKIPVVPAGMETLDSCLRGIVASRRYTTAGNACLVVLESEKERLDALHDILRQQGLTGQLVVGPSGPNLLGKVSSLPFLRRVKGAMDPRGVFGSVDGAPAEVVS